MPRNSSFRNRRDSALQRRSGGRKPYERVLVVCEGEKSEPLYFDEIKQSFRIPSLVTVRSSERKTEPKQVISAAKKYFKDHPDFDWIFAVFDRDTHRTYNEALQLATELDETLTNVDGKPVRFIAIPSVPCFEIWPLLHFHLYETRSSSAVVQRTLKGHLPTYVKGMPDLFAQTQSRLDQARRHAKRLRKQFSAEDGTDPYTDIDQLIERLIEIKDKSKSS